MFTYKELLLCGVSCHCERERRMLGLTFMDSATFKSLGNCPFSVFQAPLPRAAHFYAAEGGGGGGEHRSNLLSGVMVR